MLTIGPTPLYLGIRNTEEEPMEPGEPQKQERVQYSLIPFIPSVSYNIKF